MEATLHKLKVTELKELLARNHLVQTGKKDDLVKRLLENNIQAEDGDGDDSEDPELDDENTEQATAPVASSSTGPSATPAAPSSETSTLTPDQKSLKARAERFGIPFDPNAPSKRTAPTPTKAAATLTEPSTQQKTKAAAFDPAPLGISVDVLANRAAKFGLPEKKEPVPKGVSPNTIAAAPAKKTEEITPEMAERIAAEEEKKRKRAEKFGTGSPATNGTSREVDAKKAKV